MTSSVDDASVFVDSRTIQSDPNSSPTEANREFTLDSVASETNKGESDPTIHAASLYWVVGETSAELPLGV